MARRGGKCGGGAVECCKKRTAQRGVQVVRVLQSNVVFGSVTEREPLYSGARRRQLRRLRAVSPIRESVSLAGFHHSGRTLQVYTGVDTTTRTGWPSCSRVRSSPSCPTSSRQRATAHLTRPSSRRPLTTDTPSSSPTRHRPAHRGHPSVPLRKKPTTTLGRACTPHSPEEPMTNTGPQQRTNRSCSTRRSVKVQCEASPQDADSRRPAQHGRIAVVGLGAFLLVLVGTEVAPWKVLDKKVRVHSPCLLTSARSTF